MSLVKSHHSSLYKNKDKKHIVESEIIKEIAIYIINKHSKLIVDIENGNADKFILKSEIIKYLDEANDYSMNRDKIINDIFNYMFGYSLLQKYIDDESVSDIDGSRYDFFIIKRNGIKEILPISFGDELAFANFCKLIVIRNGGVINENDSHARVADHKYRLRINVSITPRNISGTSITIRKHRLDSYNLDDLVKLNSINKEMKGFLKSLVKSSARIVIVGKGASGKTTLLRSLLKEVSLKERILVCESDSELYPENPNFIIQKVQKRGSKRYIGLKELIKDGLTMSLDGYCVGELVGDEVWDFLKAGYTDHKIYGTLHSVGVEETFFRIATMIDNTNTNMDFNQIMSFISTSIDIIIYMKKFKVINISQVSKYIEPDRVVKLNELFSFIPIYETENILDGEFKKKNNLSGKLFEEMNRR